MSRKFAPRPQAERGGTERPTSDDVSQPARRKATAPRTSAAAALLDCVSEVEAVQFAGRSTRAPSDTQDIHRTAAAGLGGSAKLPYLDTIQAAFGHHDVTGVRSSTGGAASAAASALGARGYASGDAVAFASSPDLHTAAHEAAHTIQQQRGVSLQGGVGAAGDAYERHADRVADAVVAGRSAEAILDKGPTGGSASGSAVQLDEDPAAMATVPILSEEATAKALAYNQSRGLPATAWSQVAHVLGVESGQLDADLVHAIAVFQISHGLETDGMAGDITTQWISQEPGGEGLSDHVRSEHVIYLGVREASRHLESDRLRSVTGSRGMTAVVGSSKQHHIQTESGWADLTQDEGIQRFLATLPDLDAEKATALAAYLGGIGSKARDEMAVFIRELHEVDQGRKLWKRAVYSGHSSGYSLSGDDGTYVSFQQIGDLMQIFPRPAGQVEDLMISACNSGQLTKLDQHIEAFPNLKTIWGYVGYSPSAATGSLNHVEMWARGSAGKGAANVDARRERVAGQTGKRDQNVAVWTSDGDYETASPELRTTAWSLTSRIEELFPAYTAAYEQGDIQLGDLNLLYTLLQNVTGNFASEIDAADLAKYELARDHTLLLRHWKEMTERYESLHGEEVQAAYDTVGRDMPHLARLSRSAFQAELRTLAGLAQGTDAQPAYERMFAVLDRMNPADVGDPLLWCA